MSMNLFASTNPGDLFVLRNMGNLIPPAPSAQDISASAVIEFAVFALKVADIIVCGHSECGAMQALIHGGIDHKCCPHLQSWLQYGEESLSKVRKGVTVNPTLSEHNQLSQINVLQQMEHLMSYPFIRERVERKQLRIHGWWFDIAEADVYCYESELNQFVLIDEQEAKLILERVG